MAREKAVDKAVARLLESRNVWHYKNFSDRRNPAGVPDIIAVYNGVPLFIENKKLKGHQSKVSFVQKKQIDNITQNGGVAVIAKSAEYVEKVLDAIDSPDRKRALTELGWQTHGDDELRNNNWNKETIW